MSYKHEGPQWANAGKKQGTGIYLDSTYVYPEAHYDYDNKEERVRSNAWERKGFELALGTNAYFASKKTANYYNGSPANDINLNQLFSNKYRWEDILEILRNNYRYLDVTDPGSVKVREDYNYNSAYNVAMDIAVALKYRFYKNCYFEVSYSFRRLVCSNRFIFDFPYVLSGNKENPPYSALQDIVAREERHYIDLSIGYVFQKHEIVKPFIALGAQFTYIRIKDFLALIEEATPFDLMQAARYPNWTPNIQDMPNYMDWAGAGYGFLFAAGLKIAFHPAVSIDPIFQLSVASFGNNKNLPGYNTNICLNYLAGIRLVLNDALFVKNK
ncbi:MAG: hypothetical protein FWC10_06585 [Lentimicrobiaceae bacterium]|nr:hypothetical protein [Lentimicrobiaceae bacterium]